MKRNDWKFTYEAGVIATAAETKRATHEAKYNWWSDKKAEVMKKVAESGIEVHDSVAASYSNTKGRYGPEITIDSGLQRDLSECQDKIREHNDYMRNYAGWVQVLTANPKALLELEHDDYLFFFGE